MVRVSWIRGAIAPYLLLLLSTTQSLAAGAWVIEPVRSGEIGLPTGRKSQHEMEMGKLQVLKGKPDRLVLQRYRVLEIYRLDGDNWVMDTGPILPDSAATQTEFVPWTTGDVDGDLHDEIVVFSNTSIWVHKWEGGVFTKRLFQADAVVDQLRVGDVNRDGSNELISLQYTGDPHSCEYSVHVDRVDASQLVPIWSTPGSRLISKTDVIPSDRLGAIADYENLGYSVVLTSAGQSDVRATRFRFWTWQGGGLAQAWTFAIEGGSVALSKLAHAMVIGIIEPYRFGEHTLVVAPIFHVVDRGLQSISVLGELREGTLYPIWTSESSPMDGEPRDLLVCLDPDMGGMGLLHVSLSENPRYTFYRVTRRSGRERSGETITWD